MKSKKIKIRPVTPADYDLLESLHRAAFSTCDFGYNGEGLLARKLHEDGDALVSLLAVADGVAVGHVLFSRIQAEADHQPVIAAALAPLGVVPLWQQRGVGSLLIKAGLAALKPQGVQLCFVVGHAAYYPRFGFNLELARPFDSPYAGDYFMAVQLDPALPMATAGKVDFPAVFSGF